MSYHLEYVDKPERFDEVVEQDGVKVVIDSKALFSIIGSEMDWQEDALQAKFVFNSESRHCKLAQAGKFAERRLNPPGNRTPFGIDPANAPFPCASRRPEHQGCLRLWRVSRGRDFASLAPVC